MTRQGRHPDIEILELSQTGSARRFQANFRHGPGQQRGATPHEAERKLFAELYERGDIVDANGDLNCGLTGYCGLCGENQACCPACEGEQRIGSHACQECGGSGQCKGKAHARAHR